MIRTAGIEQAIARVCGISPPTEVSDVAVAGSISVIRVGPGRIWLVDEVGEVAARIAGAIDDAQGCITPLGEGRRRFRLSGERVPEVLQESGGTRSRIALVRSRPDGAYDDAPRAGASAPGRRHDL